jgi:steroid 5-alpha reductase family enzyme
MPLDPTVALAGAALFLMLAKTGAWLLQLRMRNAGIVDAVWALSLAMLAAGFAWTGGGDAATRWATALLGGVWGVRLGAYLWQRNWKSEEDWRYAGFRARWGTHADRNMWFFFQFQNVFSLMLAGSAFLVPSNAPAPPSWAFASAVAVWLLAVVGESVADRQMATFRANPANRGKVCDRGLWSWSRHPNYFFETVHWLAYVPLALGTPWWPATLLAPAVMAFLLLKLSGLPMLEAGLIARKPGYADYARRTSAFVPWPPRRGGAEGR